MIGCRGKRPTRGFLLLVFFALQKLTRKTTLSLLLLAIRNAQIIIFHRQSGKAAASRPNDWVHQSDNTGMGNIFAVEPKQLYTESPDLGQIRQSRTRWNTRRHSRRRYTRRRVLRRPNVRELRRGEQRIRRLRRRVRFVLLGEIFLLIQRL